MQRLGTNFDRSSHKIAQAGFPEGALGFAVGDIHGRADLLARMLDRLEAEAAAHPHLQPIVVFLGDYVDRGLESAKVIDMLLSGRPHGFERHFLRGNHEQAMQAFMRDPDQGRAWLAYGGAETLLSYRVKPVFVEAVGTQIIERTDWDQTTMTHEPQVLGQSAHLWTRTSLRPKDVDVAELYDGFTFNCLSWLEALGFCGIGEAKDFLDGGAAIARDGVIPLNTHGGQLSHGRTHGMGLIHEAITQLRGEGGERQVADARVAVVSSGGLTPSGVLLLRAGE